MTSLYVFKINILHFKTTFNFRPYFPDRMGGLKMQGPLLLNCMVCMSLKRFIQLVTLLVGGLYIYILYFQIKIINSCIHLYILHICSSYFQMRRDVSAAVISKWKWVPTLCFWWHCDWSPCWEHFSNYQHWNLPQPERIMLCCDLSLQSACNLVPWLSCWRISLIQI